MMLKWIPKQSKTQLKKHPKINAPNTPNFQILAPILEPVAWRFPGVARLFAFGGTSGGYTLGPIWASTGAPLIRFVSFWKSSGANVLQMSEILKQPMAPTTPKQKQATMPKNFTENQSRQVIVHFCCLTEPRKSGAPGLTTIGSAGLPQGRKLECL